MFRKLESIEKRVKLLDQRLKNTENIVQQNEKQFDELAHELSGVRELVDEVAGRAREKERALVLPDHPCWHDCP